MSDLYGDDILLWSEQQAEALRRRAANELDWDNLAEEIADVGSARLHTVESLLVQALRSMLKAEAWPLSSAAPSWWADAIDFRQQARRRFVPSMRQRIDVAGLYVDAIRALPNPGRRFIAAVLLHLTRDRALQLTAHHQPVHLIASHIPSPAAAPWQTSPASARSVAGSKRRCGRFEPRQSRRNECH